MKKITTSKIITEQNDDSLKSYFRDIRNEQRISQEEEIELSKRIKSGDKKALDKLVRANLRFVITVAKKYQGKGLPLIDLVQEGNIGLCRAAELFDGTKGLKFITYAVWWIRQSIIKALSDKTRIIRVPIHQVQLVNRLTKMEVEYEQVHGIKPSESQLQEITDDKVEGYKDIITNCASLDTQFDSGDTLVDIVPNPEIEAAEDTINREELHKILNVILAKLSNREADVLRMFYGIDIHPMPLEDIATRFGIGYERARQIHKNALRFLNQFYKGKLKNIYENL